jgi:hypothetical protein
MDFCSVAIMVIAVLQAHRVLRLRKQIRAAAS